MRFADCIGEPVVVDFSDSWCTACGVELPHFATVSGELQHQVTFVNVDAVETDDLSDVGAGRRTARSGVPRRHSG